MAQIRDDSEWCRRGHSLESKPSVLSESLDGLDLNYYLDLAQQYGFLIFTCEYDKDGNRHPIFKIPAPEQRRCIDSV